ncbi:hypothetical protein TNCV_4108631 [Trichonephila clavipes]|nr:hypothetical protein TNCV_4108631 [Trichonephila clavipes]
MRSRSRAFEDLPCREPDARLIYQGSTVFLGRDTLVKIKFLNMLSHRQSSGAFRWGGNWVSQLPAANGIHTKKRYQLSRNVLSLCNGKTS